MKKIICWGLLGFLAPVLNGQEVISQGGNIRRAGGYEVLQLHSKGLLPSLIVDGKRSVSVLPETLFDSPFDQISRTPAVQAAIRQAEEITYAYFVQAWKDWREAANKYLPKKYRLPELSFTLLAEVSLGSVTKESYANTIPVHLVSRFPSIGLQHAGEYTSYVERIELVLPIHLLKYLAFADTDPLQRALMEGEYRNVICNIVSGSNSYWDNLSLQNSTLEGLTWMNRFHSQRPEEEVCLKTMPFLPAKDWAYKGLFAVHNQHVMAHEFGHFLGFGHIDNSIMSTAELRDWTQTKPTEQDGLRLATLVCWNYNQQAGKEVCVPQVKPVKHERAEKGNS